MKNFETLYNQHHDDMTATDEVIFNHIVKKPKKVTSQSIQKLAQEVAVSQSSIVRFTQKMGLSGFSELKYLIGDNLSAQADSESEEEALNSDALIDSLLSTKKMFEQANIRPILEAIHHSRRIFCYGTGMGQRNILSELRRNLLSANKFTIEIGGISELESTIKTANEDDLFIVVSFSGRILEIKGLLEMVKARGTQIIGITKMSNNNLATLSDFNLYFNTKEEFYNGISISSLLPAHLLAELLYISYLKYEHQLKEESDLNENKTNNNE